MEDHTYRLVFHGKIGHGQDPAIVRERLSEMFKLESARIEQLFCGSPIVLKTKLSIGLALKYKERFEKSGALCDIEREDEIELKMEDQETSELPAKAHVNVERPSSGNIQAGGLPSSHVHDPAEEVPSPLPENIPGKAPVHDDTSKGGFFSGFMEGALVFGVIYLIGGALGLKWTLFGFELKMIVASLAGARVWNYFRDRAKDQQSAIGIRSLAPIIVVALGILAVMGHGFLKPAKHEKQVIKSITQTRLSNLQVAMNAVQGAVMQLDVPFPDTPEQILEIIRTHRQLFPGYVWMMGPELIKDEWDTKIRYEHDGFMYYTLASAGPDKAFGTEDDLVVANRGSQHSEPQDKTDPLERN